MFSIGFTEEPLEYPYDDISIPAAPGVPWLGPCFEKFLANISMWDKSGWDKSGYESHRRRELTALFKGNPKVALIVSFDDPQARDVYAQSIPADRRAAQKTVVDAVLKGQLFPMEQLAIIASC